MGCLLQAHSGVSGGTEQQSARSLICVSHRLHPHPLILVRCGFAVPSAARCACVDRNRPKIKQRREDFILTLASGAVGGLVKVVQQLGEHLRPGSRVSITPRRWQAAQHEPGTRTDAGHHNYSLAHLRAAGRCAPTKPRRLSTARTEALGSGVPQHARRTCAWTRRLPSCRLWRRCTPPWSGFQWTSLARCRSCLRVQHLLVRNGSVDRANHALTFLPLGAGCILLEHGLVSSFGHRRSLLR